jgi:hypothetical protein
MRTSLLLLKSIDKGSLDVMSALHSIIAKKEYILDMDRKRLSTFGVQKNIKKERKELRIKFAI